MSFFTISDSIPWVFYLLKFEIFTLFQTNVCYAFIKAYLTPRKCSSLSLFLCSRRLRPSITIFFNSVWCLALRWQTIFNDLMIFSLFVSCEIWITNKQECVAICLLQSLPLYRITLGQHKSDNFNWLIQLTYVFVYCLGIMVPAKSYYNKRLILLSVIQWNRGYCTGIDVIVFSM